MAIDSWKKILDRVEYFTGGGFDYYFTMFKNVNNLLSRILIIEDMYGNEPIIVEIGVLANSEDFDDYTFLGDNEDDDIKIQKTFETKEQAIEYVKKYIEVN